MLTVGLKVKYCAGLFIERGRKIPFKRLLEGLNFKVPLSYKPDISFLKFHYNEICK